MIANGENSAGGFGITRLIAEELLALGIDVLTGGNHSFDKREIHEYLSASRGCCVPPIISRSPGQRLYTGITKSGIPYAVLNMRGGRR